MFKTILLIVHFVLLLSCVTPIGVVSIVYGSNLLRLCLFELESI